MKNLILLTYLSFIMLLPQSSFAEFFRGDQLKEWCEADTRIENSKKPKEGKDRWDSIFLEAYVSGVYDALTTNQKPSGKNRLCPPQGVSVGEIVKVVKAFVQANPDQLSDPAVAVVKKALQGAFPCSK